MFVNVLLVKESHMADTRVNVGGGYMKAHLLGSMIHWGLPAYQCTKKGLLRITWLSNGVAGI